MRVIAEQTFTVNIWQLLRANIGRGGAYTAQYGNQAISLSSCKWTRAGGEIVISYTTKSPDDTRPRPHTSTIPVIHYARTWYMTCPYCARSCRTLYILRAVQCRVCAKVIYKKQLTSPSPRTRNLQRIVNTRIARAKEHFIATGGDTSKLQVIHEGLGIDGLMIAIDTLRRESFYSRETANAYHDLYAHFAAQRRKKQARNAVRKRWANYRRKQARQQTKIARYWQAKAGA